MSGSSGVAMALGVARRCKSKCDGRKMGRAGGFSVDARVSVVVVGDNDLAEWMEPCCLYGVGCTTTTGAVSPTFGVMVGL